MQGPKGEPGKDGNDYDVQIGNTETLQPGSEATASTNKDEDLNIIYLNLGIPKGEKGDSGDVDIITFDVINGKLVMYSTRDRNYTFQLNNNKLEVVYNG